MRPTFLLYPGIATLLAGCAIQGVIVKKNARPLPFIDSLGMDGIYKFKLRDQQGHIWSQMVTPEVFAQYQLGDYFNDLQPARPPNVQLEDVRTVKTIHRVSQHTRTQSGLADVQHRRKKVGRVQHTKKNSAKAQTYRKAGSRSRPS